LKPRFAIPLAHSLPRNASYAEHGYEITCRLSVRPSVCDVEVCFSHTLEYFENNFTAK